MPRERLLGGGTECGCLWGTGGVVLLKERDIRAGGWVREPYFRTGSIRESWNVGLKVAGQPHW